MCNLRRHCVLGSRIVFDRGTGIDIREIARGIMIVCVVAEWNEEARQNKNVFSCSPKKFTMSSYRVVYLSGSGPTYILA